MLVSSCLDQCFVAESNRQAYPTPMSGVDLHPRDLSTCLNVSASIAVRTKFLPQQRRVPPVGELTRSTSSAIASLDLVHRMMGVWRLIHVPLGITLFTSAFIHVIVSLFFKGPLF